MKRLTLLAVLLLALAGCSILLPVAKFLAIPIAKHLLDKPDDSHEDAEDEETQQ